MKTESGRVYTGRSAAERDADRRQRLLAAGHLLFGTEGYAATSIERLCSTANVSTRHFYLLFPNKEACFLAVYDAATGACLVRAKDVLEATRGRPMRERVAQAFVAYLKPMLEDPRAARIGFVESVVVGASSEEHRQAFREALILTIESEGRAAVERGEIADRNFRLAGLALIGAAGTVAYEWARSGDGTSSAQIEDLLVGVAERLLVD